MRARLTAMALGALCALALCAPAARAAEAQPAWALSIAPMPANFPPGGEGEAMALVTDVGAAAGSPGAVLRLDVPEGLTLTGYSTSNSTPPGGSPVCALAAQTLACPIEEAIGSGDYLLLIASFDVSASPPASTLRLEGSISGGGAAQATTASQPVAIQPGPVPFAPLAGFSAPANNPDGSPATLAGSHPYQLSPAFGFPTQATLEAGAETITNAGHPKQFTVSLPAGLVGDPAATPLRCTERQLADQGGGCPLASQVGIVDTTTSIGPATYGISTSPLYNMVAPPGHPAELATNIAGAGIYAHILPSLRTEGDYGIDATTPDVLALGQTPIFNLTTQIWGDPGGAAHDPIRGACVGLVETGCPPEGERSRIPFLTMPAACPPAPPAFSLSAFSWEEPANVHKAPYSAADLAGNPVSLAGCNALEYSPTISAQASTNLADSPAGLDFTLRQPQQPPVGPGEDPLTGRATAELKDARVVLPEGLVANPSQADGLGACTEEEIGYLSEDEEQGVHFSNAPQSCPDAAKLGTVEASSPLLAQYTEEGTKLVTDPETGAPLPRPLHGSVFLAKPFENQFDSLLALYLAVEDEQSGIVAKLAGKIEPDPRTGRLTTVFEENPQLPLSDIHLRLFEGARAPLTTPLVCGAHTTTTDLTPWSDEEAGISIEGADAHPEDTFQTAAGCSASEAAAPNAPSFEAGTQSPQAGAYSPFVLKLHREDGSQRLTGIDTTLAPGLTGKLAGIAECSDAQIAQAKAREHPNEGIAERESPSCPASSEVGAVHVAAGSGPTPFWTTGHAYLAGPYRGAPLSLAVIVPAIAGPFDLGAVVNRVALHVNPETAQIHAVSDPFPTILDGIPLDLRTVVLEMGRPQFTLNPTSCDPMQVLGAATSALGNVAPLAQRFQVGGCSSLPFKPKLTLRLKGATKRTGHPQLIANLYSKGIGAANLSRVQVKLPSSAFLDQAHIRTVCTRVQFAAGPGNGAQCPSGSIYGEALVKTPLFDYTLPGKVFLRSSNHKLPDLVIALQGPAAQPIAVELDGKTDSVKGALRNTFEAVPDQPFTEARVVLFGGNRGLIVNSRNLCSQSKRASRANVQLGAQSGKVSQLHPLVRSSCKRSHKHKKRHGHHHRRRMHRSK